ncbi:polysaccharide deacetylase family protein [Mucilaginibacter sp. AK015]|uniref:polysaccharide deacetylase family protein n=1 Tax=Mucilaginibacter sp. AK015 TaxID=2723072 RepID=UPI00160E27F3|nr:polysaccharide deacetylase family protein [Mucilaginibacter sp. AK015]MBB5397114.1 peptidoglycan/xylan/chitin deacetylase (PgdA/CDA1 family) [Mucilaginibacter sp. AK015]
MKSLLLMLITGCVVVNLCSAQPGKTEITRWQDDKKGAVSITWDDGSINQFKVALPLLNNFKFPATFFIITGQIPGSQYHGKFIGRPVQTIIKETATIATNKDNLFERASATPYLGLVGPMDYYYNAGSLVDAGKTDEAIKLINEMYAMVRNKHFKPGVQHNPEYMDAHGTTWNDIRKYAAQGHEFASHMITHPRLAILDEPNMLYELTKSKEDILNHLGARYTFSGEGPFGTENERVMRYAYKVYPALRNRMPEPWLKEITRGNPNNPGNTNKEYIQFQRGATTKTPLPIMKAWVDTTANKNNTWLVLTIHGVDGIGWEALSRQELNDYFSYIKAREKDLWVATFGNVARYMRERQAAALQVQQNKGAITITLRHTLNKAMYNLPLTLKTGVPANWKSVKITQGKKSLIIKPVTGNSKYAYVLYRAYPNNATITLSPI